MVSLSYFTHPYLSKISHIFEDMTGKINWKRVEWPE